VIGPLGAGDGCDQLIDFRKGAEGLAVLVCESLFFGAVYVFRAERASLVKLIYWDGRGMCLFAKRFRERFVLLANVQDGVVRLIAARLSALLD
jgi:transposase